MSQKFQNIMKIVIPFTGHKEVLSLHEKTLEITKDDSLTSQGDCIVGVNSGISCIDFEKPKMFSIKRNVAEDPLETVEIEITQIQKKLAKSK